MYFLIIILIITIIIITTTTLSWFCFIFRGDTFRTTLKRIGEIHSHVHIMALTATATRKLQFSIEGILGMKKAVLVMISPCKPNIMYVVGNFISISETFSPLLERLKVERQSMPRMIV